MKEIKTKPRKGKFLKRDELAERWKRSPLTTGRLARKLGLSVYRLTTKDHLYSLEEVEAVEAAAKVKPPFVNASALALKSRMEAGK